MVIYFWSTTVVLLILAFGFFVPWVRSWRLSVALICMLGLSSFSLYVYWGSSRYLAHYYSSEEIIYRQKQMALQVLLAEFRKEESRSRLNN